MNDPIHTKPKTWGVCPRCRQPNPLDSRGKLEPHLRLRRHRWLGCPGANESPPPIISPAARSLDTPPLEERYQEGADRLATTGFVDRRASSAPEESRFIAGPDPDNPTGPAVILDRITGEVVYRRRSGAKGVQ